MKALDSALEPRGRLVQRVRLVVGGVLSLFVFYPSLVADVVPVRVVALILGTLALASEIWLSAGSAKRRLLTVIGSSILAVLAVGTIEIIAGQMDDRTFAVNAEHIFVLFPIYAAFAALSYRNGGARAHATAFLGIAAATAIFAIIESVFAVSVLGREFQFATSQREGTTRALVGAEHVLVLGALLAVAVAISAIVRQGKIRYALTVLLVAGSWATGSRAAAVLCVIVALVQAIPIAVQWLQKMWFVLIALLAVGFAALGLLSSVVWTTFIPGDSGIEYSANYRFASYAVLVRVLVERPFGYFLGTVPSGEWMMGSELRGPVDLAHSADSELVFAVFAFGWVGVIAYFAAFILGVLALRASPAVGFATLLLTALGFIMSLHGWDAASAVWYALLGASFAAAVSSRRRHKPDASHTFSNSETS